jgi:hypothetical protein
MSWLLRGPRRSARSTAVISRPAPHAISIIAEVLRERGGLDPAQVADLATAIAIELRQSGVVLLPKQSD